MTLHILSVSPYAGPSFDLCRRALAPGDTLLLLCDGVYAALQDGACAQQLDALAATVAVYAIGDDCVARGISSRLLPVGADHRLSGLRGSCLQAPALRVVVLK